MLIESGGAVLIVFPVICIVVALCVMIHYEFLYQMTRLMPRINIRHRLRIVLGVIGALRYLTGVESLAGLLLITWSASFLYIEMVRYWDIE